MCHLVLNFLSCVSAKYCLNWFTAGLVVTEIKNWVFYFCDTV